MLRLLTPTPSKLPGRHSAVEQHLPQVAVEQHPPQVEVEQHPPQVEVLMLHQRRLRVRPVPLEVALVAFICHFSQVRPKFPSDTVVFQFAVYV